MEAVDTYSAATFAGAALALLRMCCLPTAPKPEGPAGPAEAAPLVQRLLATGRDVNSSDPHTGLTALHLATRDTCDVAVMAALLRDGADIHAHTAKGYSALCLLARPVNSPGAEPLFDRKRAEKATLLLQRGAKVATVYDQGNTVLHYASKYRWLQLFAVLANYGADPYVVNEKNEECELPYSALSTCPGWDAANPRQPLHIAAFVGTVAQVRHQLATTDLVWEADPRSGAHALHFACNHHDRDAGTANAIMLLAEPGCPINALTTNGFAPLHFACLRANSVLIRHLIERGADVNLRDDRNFEKFTDETGLRGLSPVQVTAKHGSTTLINYLLDHGGILDNQPLVPS